MKETIEKATTNGTCLLKIKAVHDVIYIIGGKWKISIITSLCYGNKRYSDLLNEVEGISGKMLSRELKELEMNKLIERKVLDTKPIGVEYSLTDFGKTLLPVISAIGNWGDEHEERLRALILKRLESNNQ